VSLLKGKEDANQRMKIVTEELSKGGVLTTKLRVGKKDGRLYRLLTKFLAFFRISIESTDSVKVAAKLSQFIKNAENQKNLFGSTPAQTVTFTHLSTLLSRCKKIMDECKFPKEKKLGLETLEKCFVEMENNKIYTSKDVIDAIAHWGPIVTKNDYQKGDREVLIFNRILDSCSFENSKEAQEQLFAIIFITINLQSEQLITKSLEKIKVLPFGESFQKEFLPKLLDILSSLPNGSDVPLREIARIYPRLVKEVWECAVSAEIKEPEQKERQKAIIVGLLDKNLVHWEYTDKLFFGKEEQHITTALHYYIRSSHPSRLEWIQLIVEKHPELLKAVEPKEGFTPLMQAAASLDEKCLSYLLSQPQVDLEAKNLKGQTAFEMVLDMHKSSIKNAVVKLLMFNDPEGKIWRTKLPNILPTDDKWIAFSKYLQSQK